MKITSYLLAGAALFASGTLVAQTLRVAVPATAVIINGTQTERQNNATFWVCPSSGLSVRGNNNTYFAENGSALSVDGNNNIVYTRTRGMVDVQGNNNMIYVTGTGRVVISGNNNQVTSVSTAQVTIIGQNNTRMALGSMDFDYASAPAGGCPATTITSVGREASELSVYPNPAAQGGWLYINTPAPIQEARLLDALGRQVATYPAGTTRIDLRTMPRGAYILSASLPNGVEQQRIQVQ